jgi:hypothetical protein
MKLPFAPLARLTAALLLTAVAQPKHSNVDAGKRPGGEALAAQELPQLRYIVGGLPLTGGAHDEDDGCLCGELADVRQVGVGREEAGAVVPPPSLTLHALRDILGVSRLRGVQDQQGRARIGHAVGEQLHEDQ